MDKEKFPNTMTQDKLPVFGRYSFSPPCLPGGARNLPTDNSPNIKHRILYIVLDMSNDEKNMLFPDPQLA